MPNIVFVLSISRTELENSIRGYYGSERIDASNYLRRFIDIQFDVPQPNSNKFCEMLVKYYGFNDFFMEGRGGLEGLDGFYEMATLMFTIAKIDLRTWDRIFAHSRLAAIQVGSGDQIIMELIFLLCFLRITQPEFYSKIRAKQFTVQELVNELENKLPRMLIEPNNETNYGRPQNYHAILAIAELFYIYDYSINGRTGSILSAKQGDESLNLDFTVINKELFKNDIDWIKRYLRIDKDISFFTDMVDMASNFKD